MNPEAQEFSTHEQQIQQWLLQEHAAKVNEARVFFAGAHQRIIAYLMARQHPCKDAFFSNLVYLPIGMTLDEVLVQCKTSGGAFEMYWRHYFDAIRTGDGDKFVALIQISINTWNELNWNELNYHEAMMRSQQINAPAPNAVALEKGPIPAIEQSSEASVIGTSKLSYAAALNVSRASTNNESDAGCSDSDRSNRNKGEK